jgi:peroxiredoxin family protein
MDADAPGVPWPGTTPCERGDREDRLCLLVFSGELDRLLAAFMMATTAAACGTKVSMFFTFWGTVALKRAGRQAGQKRFVERLLGWMLPGGLERRKLSHLDFSGLGRRMMQAEMRRKRIPSLTDLVALAAESDVELLVCESSLSLMGIRRDELLDYPRLTCCGAAHFLDTASRSRLTLMV